METTPLTPPLSKNLPANPTRQRIVGIAKLGGLGYGIYLAHKQKKGTWAYIGFGVLGLIGGAIVGNIIANLVEPKPIQTPNK
jgi:hypothetical protein